MRTLFALSRRCMPNQASRRHNRKHHQAAWSQSGFDALFLFLSLAFTILTTIGQLVNGNFPKGYPPLLVASMLMQILCMDAPPLCDSCGTPLMSPLPS
mmetsp:Transcript_73806/g.116896  ORF Transcript_73806/g.116896 Transcript_73806/m.116896 type:complete len:98 (-) Transcript_73806:811-1104(-)